MTQLPNQQERLWAGIAHISAPAPMFSFLTPLVIWAILRAKSRYVADQALQAAAVQFLMALIAFFGFGAYAGGFFLLFAARPSVGESLLTISIISLLVMILLELALIVYSLVGAVMAFLGKDFRYILIGRWITRYNEASSPAAVK